MSFRKEATHPLYVKLYLIETFQSGVVNVWTYRRCFVKFRSREFSLKDDTQSGQLSKVDNAILWFILDNNPHLITKAITKQFAISHSTVEKHIQHFGFVLKPSIWVSKFFKIRQSTVV